MSIEKQARKALRRAVFWRVVGAACDLPSQLFGWVGKCFLSLSDFFAELGDALRYFESDAARRYQLLTGIDLALAGGDDDRYELLDPEKAEAIRREELEDEDD